MVAEIFGGIGALKAAFDMAKSIADMSDAAKRDRLSINLQKEILSAQSAQSDLLVEVSTLKEKLRDFEQWDTEKERYKLCDVALGAYAYALKKERAISEPPHWLCTDCYENRKKSILKTVGADYVHTNWKCHACGSFLRVPLSLIPGFAEDTP